MNFTVYSVIIVYIQYKRGEDLNILISNSKGVPIYDQVREQIKTAILNGDIKEGEMLPSIRQLAKDLKISVITTMRAYTELENEGLVVNVQGKGCYVLPQNVELIKEQKLKEIEENFISAIDAARIIKLSKDDLIKILKILLEDEYYE